MTEHGGDFADETVIRAMALRWKNSPVSRGIFVFMFNQDVSGYDQFFFVQEDQLHLLEDLAGLTTDMVEELEAIIAAAWSSDHRIPILMDSDKLDRVFTVSSAQLRAALVDNEG